MAELLLEVLSEEIPARMQRRGAEELKRCVLAGLEAAGLAWDRAEAFSTPRRLVLLVDGLPKAQADTREERRGPRADAPDKAIKGFLSSTGLRREDLEERTTDKGTFLFATIERRGRPTAAVLAGLMPDALAQVAWPKSMRWGTTTIRWVRPIHSILCLFDGEVVRFAFGPIAAGNETAGHRFHAPERVAVAGYDDYRARLRDGRVMLNAAEREAFIAAADGLDAAREGLSVIEDDVLLEEVAGLVEWPVVLTGRFDEAFLALPEEVLRASMRGHQKYFAMRDREGHLAPRFICVANIEAKDGGRAIIAGNERVLKARLADAEFFWRQDRKSSLAERVPHLSQIIFHARLGTLDQKVDRLEALALEIAEAIPGADRGHVRSAARLAKADLVTQMVGEFPELQGVMGRYYALADGEPSAVAEAIAQHYSPLGPGDPCPTAPVAVAVALADKIDTLVGFFAIGETPTGSKDPFALRRAAQGVIRLVLENRLSISLNRVFERAYALYGGQQEASFADASAADVSVVLLSFIAERLKVHLREKGVRHDLISAVFALTGEDDLVRLLARVEALDTFLRGEDGANLLTAYRRASNIVQIEEKKDGCRYEEGADAAAFRQEEEQRLFEELNTARRSSGAALDRKDFGAAMAALAGLRRPVDLFFDRVTVNADEPAIRANRLRLLAQIRRTLNQVADFSRIEG